MPTAVRKFFLAAHVLFSIGWIGAVASFLALALVGLASPDELSVRSMYVSMDIVGWRIIVPLCLAALATGLIQGLATPLGLFRHYWILLKLGATVVLTALLMLHMRPTERLAAAAMHGSLGGSGLHQLQLQLAVDAAGALFALIALAALAIYKPRGLTPYGKRKLTPTSGPDAATALIPRWAIIFSAGSIATLVAVRILSGVGHH